MQRLADRVTRLLANQPTLAAAAVSLVEGMRDGLSLSEAWRSALLAALWLVVSPAYRRP